MDRYALLINIGARLRSIRLEAGFTQESLARAMGRRFAAVAAWEAGEAELGATELTTLVRVLGCDLHFVLTGSRPPRGKYQTLDHPLVRIQGARRVNRCRRSR